MMDQLVGTCSNCGGRVMTYGMWGSILQPPTKCIDCGAEKSSHGPVIDMAPPKKTIKQGISSDIAAALTDFATNTNTTNHRGMA